MLILSSPSVAARARRPIRAPRARSRAVPRARHARAFLARETARLRAHFREVLAELRAAPLAPFSPPQRAARARQIAELERYARAGRFPRNLDSPGVPIPYFVDAMGTHCAMAHLIAVTGAGELVARVAAAKNNAFIRELSDDPALLSWLDEAGLTVAEAARIQPGYCFVTKSDECFCDGDIAQAVLEGTALEATKEGETNARVKVVTVHGDATLGMVGDELVVSLLDTDPGVLPVVAVGDVVLVSVTKSGVGEINYDNGHQVAKDGTVLRRHCSLELPRPRKEDLITALLSKEDRDANNSSSPCSDYLATINPVWGEPMCTDTSGGGIIDDTGASSSSSGASSGGGGQGMSSTEIGGCSLPAMSAGSPLVLGTLVVAAMWSLRRRARRAASRRSALQARRSL
jgi:hypothetical protein